jgi:hypothetical protein
MEEEWPECTSEPVKGAVYLKQEVMAVSTGPNLGEVRQ